MFDLITLRFISVVSFACFTLANLFIWRLVPQERALRDWVVASAALASGLLLLGLYGIVPDFLSIAAGNALVMLGFGFLHAGTRQLLGAGPGFGWHWLAAALVFFICLLASSVAVRIVATSILYIPFLLACAGLFWFSQVEPGLQLIKRIAAVTFAFGALLSLLRALSAPPTSLSTADFSASASGIQVAPYVYLTVFSLWLPITLLMIVSSRLQNQRAKLLAQDEASHRKLRESEERHRSLIEWSPNAIAVHRHGQVLYANPAARKMFGASSEQDLVGRRILDLTHPDFHQAVTDRVHESLLNGYAASTAAEKFLKLDGTPINVEIQSTSMLYEGELAVHTSLRDVTGRLQADAELRIAAIAFESQDGMFITDANKMILRVNRAFTRITGYTAEESIGETPALLSSGRHDAGFYTVMWTAIEQTGSWFGEIWNRRKNGEIYPQQLTITAVLGGTGKVANYVATLHDITQRKRLEEDVKKLAFYDPLTRLPNRRLFNDRLSQTLVRAKRSQSRMALMFIDLDKFKPINDTHGHEAGDWVLEAVARRLEGCLRASDTAARVGGDEFLVLLLDVQTCEDGLAVGEKIRLEMEQPFVTPSQLTLRASASIGIAVYPDHGNTEHDLLRLGDSAMYEAKKHGGNAVRMAAASTEPERMNDVRAAGQSIVRLTWKAAFASGNQAIDNEHRELFRLGNILLGLAMSKAEEPAQFEAAFDTLLAHVAEHFAHEEAMLQSVAYEQLEEHTLIHQKLMDQARKLRHPPPSQAQASVGELVDFLVTEIVARHMLMEDRKFAGLFFDEQLALSGAAVTANLKQ